MTRKNKSKRQKSAAQGSIDKSSKMDAAQNKQSTLNTHAEEDKLTANHANTSLSSLASSNITDTTEYSSNVRDMKLSNSGKCLNKQIPKNTDKSRENSETRNKNYLSEQNRESRYDRHSTSSKDRTSSLDDDLAWNNFRKQSNETGTKRTKHSEENVNSSNNLSSNTSEQRDASNSRERMSKDSRTRNKNYSPEHEASEQTNKSSAFQHRKASRSSERSKKDHECDIFLKQLKNKDMEFSKVVEVQGDLFLASDEYSLGHCVAEDMNMGSGIAVTFRQMFKNIDKLLEQRQRQGGLAILENHQRFIYYLVTKRVSNGKPTLHTLWSSLQKMKDHIVHNNVKKVALPRIGCGLDGLEWKDVKKMLEYTFRNVDIEIKIFNFQQDPFNVPTTRIRKCPVKNVPHSLAEIEYGTVIVYFGSEDGAVTNEIKSLTEKFPYISNIYRIEKQTIGTYVRTDRHNNGYCFYGCIVRKHHTDPFSFESFQKCLNSLQVQNRKDQYSYIAIQAFMEEENTFIVSKLVNLMRNSLTNVEIYVCWPTELRLYMPNDNY